MARPVWLGLFKFYSVTEYPRPYCLEKPLDLYTALELEHLILRREKTRICWALSKIKTTSIQRRFDLSPEAIPNSAHLVEGGRWLLVATESYSILCYDIHASIIEPSELIPTPFDKGTVFDDRESEILFSVDMDLGAEYLTFNLGVITRRTPEIDSICPRYLRWIEIWRVSSDVAKGGRVKGLRAERLARFPEQHRNTCSGFRLKGRQVAYSLDTDYYFGSLRDGPCTIIVEWMFCDPISLVYDRRVIWHLMAGVSPAFHLSRG